MANLLKVGQRVEVTGKDIQGEVAYIGTTAFAQGKWVGLILDEPKGKNNGTIKNKTYFQCKENHGMFIRQSQLSIITDTGSRIDLANTGMTASSPSVTSPEDPLRTPMKSRLTSVRRKSSPASHAPPSRASSRQSLSGRSKESRSREDMNSSTSSLASTDTPSSKKSFVEGGKPKVAKVAEEEQPSSEGQTGFVETLKPQFTPGQVVSTATTTVSSGRALALEPSPELEALKEQHKDLTEKLETLRIRYKEKVHELETLKLQLEQSVEFKSKIMEAQASLKKELEKVKKEKEEAVQAREELSEIADTLEMTTLDKEMAEEKADAIQKEYEQAQERIEELEMELEILRSELSDKMEGVTQPATEEDGSSSFKMKQLVQQNEKLKETLVRLRDLSAHEKHEKQKFLKEFEEKKADFDTIFKSNEKLRAQIDQMEEQISELHANVDAALGAEEMVETLGQQKLSLEERVKELEEAVQELEELQDINDQLQEGFKEQELDFRQELDMKNHQVWEAQRKTESVLESLADRELTIVKFRELVQRFQEENQELRSQLEITSKSSSLSTSAIPEMLDFKKMFAETKAHARAIELELRHMEVQQAQQHVQYLLSYMPDTFLTRGGDGDAIMLVLLMPRLLAKCQVLISQLRDKFPPVTTVDKSNVTSAQQFSAMSRFSAHIHMLQAILHQFVHSLNTCKPEMLLKVGASYPNMAQQEKALDSYIEMLKREQVDENLNTESLEKIVTYFNTLHPMLMLQGDDCSIHEGLLLADIGKGLLCALDSVQTDISIISAILPEGEGIATLNKIKPSFDTLRAQLRQVRHRAEIPNLLLGQNTDLTSIALPVVTLSKILSGVASRLAVLPTDNDNTLSPMLLAELLKQSFNKHNDIIGDKERNVDTYIPWAMNTVTTNVTNIVKALQDNEDKYLSLKNAKDGIDPPLVLRSKQVKEELNAMAGLRRKLESKEEDLRELRLNLRAKQDELAEMILRKEIADKKLANVIRDNEITVETLKRKVDEAQQQLRRKEKEFEDTMDHLQKDIDSLEVEKVELKDKLKSAPKKSSDSLKFISSSMVTSTTELPGGGTLKVMESPILLEEIRHLKSLVKKERKSTMSEQMKKYVDMLNKLGPIHIPKKIPDDEMKRVNELKKKLKELHKDYLNSMPTVVNLSGKKHELWGSAIRTHILQDELRAKKIRERTIALQNEVMLEVVKQKKGGHILTDLTLFPTPEMVKVIQENEPVDLCEITIPTVDPVLGGKVIPLNVDIPTFDNIRKKLYELSAC
ncbi:dynactin subunit 1 isoform X2 [Cimex lectularius]|uniref:Dynactin subunit 1 n=1 Tax=Cimex lectularius TaxID=79782 RepID=A0A8I6TH29_CIMLE|nr:dynactin subunit 1 isoform X2 [Cimex lectularius]